MEISNIREFEEKVFQSKGTVLVEFFAVWCGPCRLLAPILQELASEFPVIKVDVDKFAELAEKYGVMSVPTMVIFRNGEERERMVGVRSKEELAEKLKKWDQEAKYA